MFYTCLLFEKVTCMFDAYNGSTEMQHVVALGIFLRGFDP